MSYIYAYIKYNTTFLAQKVLIIHLCHVKGHKIWITSGERTWHWACLVFMMLTLQRTTSKVRFLQYEICIKTLCTTLYLSLHWNISVDLRMVAQPVFNRNAFLLNLQHVSFQELKRYTQNP